VARTVNKLSPLLVKRLAQPGYHSDGQGLYLCVSPSGAKSWRIIYTRQGKRVELGIGPARVVSLGEAREKAAEAQRLLARGIDPKREWAVSKEPEVDRTFGAVALDLIQSRKPGWKSTKHGKQWQSTLQTYAARIWAKDVADVSADDLLQILRPIWSTKEETAHRVRGRIEAVLDAAKVRGLRGGENAARWKGHLELLLPKRKAGPKRHQPAMHFDEVPAFMARLKQVDGLSARALELTILTACRTSEVLHARWSEFDVDAAVWTIPKERMKAGKPHRVPLSDAVLALLNQLPRQNEFLFPGARPDKPLSNMSMQMCLRRMQLGHYTVHGFRSSFRDWCGEMTSFPREIAEQALAHAVGNEVERAYRRGDALEKRRELMEAWVGFLSTAATDWPQLSAER
jgi:integrase